MAWIHTSNKPHTLINKALVNFQPAEYERIKQILLKKIDVVAGAFCESELSMLCAVRSGKARIGTMSDYKGRFCIYIEYQGIQVLKPVHATH